MKTLNLLIFNIALIFLFTATSSYAQETPREIGIRASGLNDFNFIYKKQLKENKFLRLRTGALNLNFNTIDDNSVSGFAAAIGFENRKPLDDKLSFTYGFEPSIAFNIQSINSRFQTISILSAGYVLGFNLNVSDNFGLNIETIPALTATFRSDDRINDNDFSSDNAFGLGFGFNSNFIALSAVYRFVK